MIHQIDLKKHKLLKIEDENSEVEQFILTVDLPKDLKEDKKSYQILSAWNKNFKDLKLFILPPIVQVQRQLAHLHLEHCLIDHLVHKVLYYYLNLCLKLLYY